MLGVLPVVFASDAIVAIGRLREVTIMIVFPLPLALVIGRGLLARLRGPGAGTPGIHSSSKPHIGSVRPPYKSWCKNYLEGPAYAV
jgi:hypothetical protein